jgi:hypothetical protein
MSTSTSSFHSQEEYLRYRSLSVLAIVTVVLAIIGLPALVFPQLLILPSIGAVLGLYGVVRINRRRDELTGIRLAWAGLITSVLVLVVGAGYSSYIYAHELPAGYLRITYDQLQPDPAFPQLPIPPSALQLNGQRIFVKGYVHPGVDRRSGIRQFVLVPDMKTCCFGGQPALTDMIEVKLREPLRVDFTYRRRKLGGILSVSPNKKSVAGLDGVYYQLDADYLR